MERNTVLQWFEQHPDAVHGDMSEIVSRCERAVRRHAREDAWLAAKAYITHRRHEWERGIGAHASEAYAAREVCHELAYGLRHHEPRIERNDSDHLAGGPVKNAVDATGWEFLTRWILQVAREEERATWKEIVGYVDHHAPDLIRAHHLSDDCSHDHTACFGPIAARIAKLLERDCSVHAFPH
jgi:hypothetical protein